MSILAATRHNKQTPLNLIFRGLLAFCALLALRLRVEVGSGLETGNFLIDNLSRLANQFYYEGIADLIIFAAIFVLLGFIADKEKSIDIYAAALSLVLGCFYTIAIVCRDLGNFSFFLANAYQLALSLLCIFGYSVLFYGIVKIVFHFMCKDNPQQEKPLCHPVRSAALIMLLCWLPWLLMNYPCSFNGDSIYQLGMARGLVNWGIHHPPLNTAIIALCVAVGDAVWDVNFGCFLYVVLQSVLGAFIFSYGMATLYRMGLSRRAWTIMLLFFTATPFWGCFVQWLEKDLIYAELFLLDMILMIPVIKERHCSVKRAIMIGLISLIAVLLRKTGLYEIFPWIVLMFFWVKRPAKVRILASVLAVLCLSSCVNNRLYPALGMEPASIKEALNIPFQQTARYVLQYPDEVTDEEKAAIDAVLIYDKLDEYIPTVSDPVKNNYRGDNTALPEYFKAWFNMLLKHPVCYFEAAFMISYGYFAPVELGLDAYIQSVYFPQAEEFGVYRVFGDFPTKLFDCFREIFIQFPAINLLCSSGTYSWVLLVCFVLLLKKKQYAALLMFVPGIMDVLICIASPLCNSLRYELPVVASTPFIVGWTLIHIRRANK